MADGLEQWWKELPLVTKYLFALSFGLTLAGNFGLVDPYLIILDFPKVFYGFEIWRLITCFFFHGKLGFGFLMHMVFLVKYGQSLEMGTFAGRTADYIFFILFGSVILLVTSYFMNFMILGMSLIMMLIYLWSRKNPNVPMSFMFGIRFQSLYFPWVLCAFSLLMGGFPLMELVGIIVGHIYFFLEDIYPQTGGTRLLKTPAFLSQLFPQAPVYGSGGPQGNQGVRGWGRGQQLGGN